MSEVAPDPLTFGEYLGDLLDDRGLSPADLAQRINVSASTVTKWLNGSRRAPALKARYLDRLTFALRLTEAERTNLFKAQKRSIIADILSSSGAYDDFSAAQISNWAVHMFGRVGQFIPLGGGSDRQTETVMNIIASSSATRVHRGDEVDYHEFTVVNRDSIPMIWIYSLVHQNGTKSRLRTLHIPAYSHRTMRIGTHSNKRAVVAYGPTPILKPLLIHAYYGIEADGHAHLNLTGSGFDINDFMFGKQNSFKQLEIPLIIREYDGVHSHLSIHGVVPGVWSNQGPTHATLEIYASSRFSRRRLVGSISDIVIEPNEQVTLCFRKESRVNLPSNCLLTGKLTTIPTPGEKRHIVNAYVGVYDSGSFAGRFGVDKDRATRNCFRALKQYLLWRNPSYSEASQAKPL